MGSEMCIRDSINAEPTEMDHLADLLIRESISQVLPIVVQGAKNLTSGEAE